MSGLAQPLIGFGQVRHTRLRPVRNAFAYAGYFLMLPMRSMRAHAKPPSAGDGATAQLAANNSLQSSSKPSIGVLAHNRFGLLSFYDCDHGKGSNNALAWLDDLLQTHGIHDATGEAWLHCYPRVLGHTFKPVSFWYCHAADASLRAIVVEVNNTFGESHCYLLDAPLYGHELVADKVFHVSPFCQATGRYRFRFMRTPATSAHAGQTVARIDYDDGAALLQTSVSGTLQLLTKHSMRHAFFSYGAMTLGVVARIHWQALKLWLKSVPFVKKPEPPALWTTR